MELGAGDAGRIAVHPSRRLVRLITFAALGSLGAVAWPPLTLPALAFLALVAAVAGLDWWRSRHDPAPVVERVLPRRVVRGRPAAFLYRLSRPQGGATTVSLLDELPADLGGDLRVDDVTLEPGELREITRDRSPARRGTRMLGPTLALWWSRFGLLSLRTTVLAGGAVDVVPPVATPERRTGLTHRSLREELGIRPRPARGAGTEFESLREYVPGDDPRHLDWHATARRRRPIVRQYQTERRHTVFIAVDTGRLMAARVDAASKLDHALDCAVALARASAEYGDRVGFLAFDRELRVLAAPASGWTGVTRLVEATLALAPRPVDPSYRVLVENLARHQKKRALVVVLTDFAEGGASGEIEAYLAALARRHCVLLVALRDRLFAELDDREPGVTQGRLYRRLALQDLVVEREAALARIGRFGAQTLDLDPARITVPVLNRYLAIRQAALL